MAIKKIKVLGLFHTFNHEINFDNKDIAIIIGENGIGKTTMLKILYSILNKNFGFLFSIDFYSIEIDFYTSNWCITKNKEKEIQIENNKYSTPYVIKSRSEDNEYSWMRDMVGRVEYEKWLDKESTLCDACGRQLHSRYRYYPFEREEKAPDWYEECIRENHIVYIKTQRLYQIPSYREDKHNQSLEHVVNLYSKDLVKIIQQNNSRFTAESIKLDSSFPKRLLKERNKNKIQNSTQISSNLKQLNQYRNLLSKVGIIEEQEDDEVLKALGSVEDYDTLSIFNLYIKDTREKLSVFSDTASKLEILQSIINKRFKHKKLFIDRKEGFTIKANVEARKIDITKLSSGEQNELIIFYKLLFKTKKNDIVMIDEPEISLHIAWQQHLIGDLKEVAEATGIKLIISTHSPDIIGDNWSLVQTLSGQE